MSMEKLHTNGVISQKEKLFDGVYFNLKDKERKTIDDTAKEIYLQTRSLSLPSNKMHYESKHEFKNDNIKGKDDYPRTIAGVLHFLYDHSM